jgi:hypothetical protein
MLLAFIAGWVLGSASLYSYLVVTAKEPPHPECMDCDLSDCANCRIQAASDGGEYRLAA